LAARTCSSIFINPAIPPDRQPQKNRGLTVLVAMSAMSLTLTLAGIFWGLETTEQPVAIAR